MPKYRVVSSETVYRRGVVEAPSREALVEMDIDDMDLEEFDSIEELADIEEVASE